MYGASDAHPLTVITIVGTFMVPPIYVLATYVLSGASPVKGVRIGMAWLLIGAFMFWVCISELPSRLGLPGNLIVPAAWVLPSLTLFLWRKWILAERLSQRLLVGLQLFRAIGALFLFEMARGNIPGIFAYPAGIGDLLVAAVALTVLVRYRGSLSIPSGAIMLVIFVGVVDLLSAFFFGFFSSQTPLQLFFPTPPNNVVAFPTGLIPLFLVPCAIFFHVLSGLNYVMHENAVARVSDPSKT